MDAKLRQALSPVALATALVLTGLEPVLPVPWFSPGSAQAAHCTPPCDCACVCNCDACACNCDCAGCGVTDDDQECTRR